MVSTETRAEIEEYLGRVPSWIEALPDPAADHSWETVRDLQLGEDTDLTQREKALVGLGAAAIQCPYCAHFHTEEAKLEEVTDEERAEAIAVASDVQYSRRCSTERRSTTRRSSPRLQISSSTSKTSVHSRRATTERSAIRSTISSGTARRSGSERTESR